MTDELKKKIDRVIRLLQSVGNDGKVIEVSYSGGKDSDVILELAKMAGINYRAIYKNTTIDPPGTIKHVREMGVEIKRPEKSFFQIIEQKGFPTRRARFCCEKLKEYRILDTAIQGIRRDESSARAKRYKEPVICRLYGKGQHVNVVLPILDWTIKDEYQFIKERNIKLASLYYDKDGRLNLTKRLGCMGCPLRSDNGLADFKERPSLVRAWCRAGKKWMDIHPNAASHKKFGNVYRLFVQDVFFHSYLDFQSATSGMFGDIDCKKFLEDYFKIRL